jgi:hypothetical protein
VGLGSDGKKNALRVQIYYDFEWNPDCFLKLSIECFYYFLFGSSSTCRTFCCWTTIVFTLQQTVMYGACSAIFNRLHVCVCRVNFDAVLFIWQQRYDCSGDSQGDKAIKSVRLSWPLYRLLCNSYNIWICVLQQTGNQCTKVRTIVSARQKTMMLKRVSTASHQKVIDI